MWQRKGARLSEKKQSKATIAPGATVFLSAKVFPKSTEKPPVSIQTSFQAFFRLANLSGTNPPRSLISVRSCSVLIFSLPDVFNGLISILSSAYFRQHLAKEGGASATHQRIVNPRRL